MKGNKFNNCRLAGTVALAAAAWLAPSIATADFIDNFDDGLAQDWALTGLWHVTDNSPNGTPALGYVKDETPGTELNGNFDTGERNSGTATTPLLACGVACSVAFDWLNDTEGGATYDVFSVYVLLNGSTQNILTATGAPNLNYVPFFEDLLPIVGSGNTFQVQFFFDTVDSIANDGAGIRVDNFRFRNVELPITSVPEPSTLLLLWFGLLGLYFVRRHRVRHFPVRPS